MRYIYRINITDQFLLRGQVSKIKKHRFYSVLFRKYLAEWTGLEPATPGVTGRYSNQLNYHSAQETWWVMTESNRRHSACKADALPTELITL